jgi:transcriptional regulator with XRE-family HTH domain
MNLVGPKLRKIRSQRGLSQNKLAILLNLQGWDVSRDIIARIESQVRCVTDIELTKLVKVLKIKVQDLLGL